jgi:nitrate reductase cytochrome c-type subunit
MWDFDKEEDVPDTAERFAEGGNDTATEETDPVTTRQKDFGSKSPVVPHAIPGYFASNSPRCVFIVHIWTQCLYTEALWGS